MKCAPHICGGVKFFATVASCLAFCGGAGAQNLWVHNRAQLPPREVQRVEKAVQKYVNSPLRAHWGTPRIAWRRDNAWPVYIERVPGQNYLAGEHYYGSYPSPSDAPPGTGVRAAVYIGSNPLEPWRIVLSHEVIEMLVDPHLNRTVMDPTIGLQLVEVCDPVQHHRVRVNGIDLSDFVFPRWYHIGSQGPWDYLHKTTGPEKPA